MAPPTLTSRSPLVPRRNSSWKISNQLQTGASHRPQGKVNGIPADGKYLLVFDSAEAFENPIESPTLENPELPELAEELKSFIAAAKSQGHLVIIATQHETTRIANIVPEL
jgi:hypothetical protein